MYCWIIGFTILTFYSIQQVRDIGKKGVEAHRGLCAFKGDLQDRVNNSEQFLKDHPNGIPGIPIAVIKTSVKGQKSVLEALRNFKC